MLERLGMLAGHGRAGQCQKLPVYAGCQVTVGLILRVHRVCREGSESWFYAVRKEAMQLSDRDT